MRVLLPLLPDVVLSSGVVIRHTYLPNGAQSAAPTDRYWMTPAESREYEAKRPRRTPAKHNELYSTVRES